MNSFRYKIPYHTIYQSGTTSGPVELISWMRQNCGSQGIDWCYSTKYNFCFRYKKHYNWFLLRWL